MKRKQWRARWCNEFGLFGVINMNLSYYTILQIPKHFVHINFLESSSQYKVYASPKEINGIPKFGSKEIDKTFGIRIQSNLR